MERRYALPIAFAAALHAALLFGFSKPPPKATIIRQEIPICPFPMMPREEEPPLVTASDNEASRPKEVLDRPPPTQPEPLVIDVPTNFRIPTPPPQRIDNIDTKQILPPSIIRRGEGGPGGWGDILSIGLLDRSPRMRFQPAPLYPTAAKHQGLRGEVVVEFVVDEQGRVLDPRIVSSTDRVFEEPTLRAVARWVFEPGRRGGAIVRFRMAVPVVFNLND